MSKISFLSQVFNTAQNFFISPNFILLGSRVVKILNFEPNFQHHSKFLDFAKFHCSWVQSGQKCSFWAKFSRQLKISGFSQISSFPGPKWSNSQFEPNFHCDWKFQNFAKFHPSHVLSGQKCQFWSKFLTRLKMSGFCQIPSSAGPSQKCQFWAKFSTRLKISGCCQISSFAGPEWSKVNFEPNVWRNWKFLDCAKFHPLHVVSSQKCQFWAKFWHKSEFLDFAKFHP